MTQTQLDRAVARLTGESVQTVRSLGFGPLHEENPSEGPEDQFLWLDCPFCRKPVLLSCQSVEGLPEIAECLGCDIVFDYRLDEIYSAKPEEVEESIAEPLYVPDVA